MNAPLPDGNEPVIDIFILSANSPLSTQLEKQLRDEGYYVTLFSEGTHLLETLRNGKPNLLMCDTTIPESDGFEVCRQIKADDYLWNIPVLIISGASDLGDLLGVLDCNADNFIAHPFDFPYLLSLIEGMLTTPVERQTPEQIKTQFKIKHEDQVFVVTADRRKLLEFLLSSFEIAVTKSADLSRVSEDKENLGITIRKLEDTVLENTRVIGIINENLKSKEQRLAETTVQLSDREESVREKNAAIDQLSRDLSMEKSAHAEARDEIQRIRKEKDESLAAHQATIDQLQQQDSDLSSELAIVKPALERTTADLERETGQRKEAEIRLSTTATLKEQLEKALNALNTEFEQLKINFGTEKNRAEEAETGLKAVLQAKDQAEMDLTGIINDLKNTAKDQAAALIRLREESATEISRLKEESATEISRLKEESATEISRLKEESATEISRLREELESENTRLREESGSEITRLRKELEAEQASLRQTEEDLQTLTAAREQSEASLQATIDERQKYLLDLQAWLDTAKSQLDEKEQTIKTLSAENATISAARESVDQELASVSRVLAETNTALGQKKKDMLELEARLNNARSKADEKEQAIKKLSEEIAAISSKKRSAEGELATLSRSLEETKSALEAETRDIATAKEDLLRVYEEKEKAEAVAESLSASLNDLRAELAEEKSRAGGKEEQMKALIQQRDRELEELRTAHDDTRTALSSHATTLEQLKRELESAVSARTELEEKLQIAQEKIHEKSQELAGTSEGRAQDSQRLTALAGQLEQVKTTLEQETLRRQEAADQLREALSQQQQQEQDIERLVSETKTLHADLGTERRMHDETRKQARSLEEQVSALNLEKSKAEQAAADLSAEIKDARVALADEWEDHMTDKERLAEVARKIPQPVPVQFSGVKREAEIIKKRSLIVKAPTVPSEIRPPPRAIVAIDPVKAPDPASPPIQSVEDLYEDDEDDRDTPDNTPEVSIVKESDPGPVRYVLPEKDPRSSGDQESFFEDNDDSDPGERGDEDDPGDEDSASDDGDAASGSGQSIAFDRTQWLDLLKWSHHCEDLTQDQRMQIVRMGRLIQKGRKLTNKQEEQVLEMIALVQRLGYRIP